MAGQQVGAVLSAAQPGLTATHTTRQGARLLEHGVALKGDALAQAPLELLDGQLRLAVAAHQRILPQQLGRGRLRSSASQGTPAAS